MKKPGTQETSLDGEDGRRLPDLDENMNLVRQALGVRSPRFKFRDTSIAHALGVDKSSWTKMRKGTRNVSPIILSSLIEYIGHGLVPGVLELPKVDFRSWMEKKRIGLFDTSRPHRALHRLLERAYSAWDPSDHRATKLKIVSSRRGGLDIVKPAPEENCTVLVLRAKIQFEASFPKGGHIVLLSEQLDNGEIVALMPSKWHEDTTYGDVPPVFVPQDPLHVSPPIGYYRAYGLWSADLFPDEITNVMRKGSATSRGTGAAVLDQATIEALTDFISNGERLRPRRRIVALDYKVVQRL